MNVVAAGVVVRWDPSGFSVVGWHRHDRLVESGCPDDVYEHLAQDELCDVMCAHMSTFLPGAESQKCGGWHQERLFA